MLPEYLEGLVTGPGVFLITILKAFKRVLGTRGLEPLPLSRTREFWTIYKVYSLVTRRPDEDMAFRPVLWTPNQ